MSPPDGSLDGGLQDYLKHVTCAITGRKATAGTPLCKLYNYTDAKIDNDHLQNLMGISKPAVPCTLFFAQKRYPPVTVQRSRHYDLVIRFDKLLYTPIVRLECRIAADLSKKRGSHTLVVEFHFNPCDGTELQEFAYTAHKNSEKAALDTRNADITFKFNGVTTQGFNHIVQSNGSYSEDQIAVIALLRSFRRMDSFRYLRFELQLSKLSPQDQRAWSKLMSHLPGGDGERLHTLGMTGYPAFPKSTSYGRSEEELIEQWMMTPLHSMVHPPPMVPLRRPGAFPSIRDYVEQMGVSASCEDMEQRTALRLWEEGQHTGTIFETRQHAIICVNSTDVRLLESNGGQDKCRLPDELNVKITLRQRSGNSKQLNLRAFLTTEKLPLPHHDYYFVITSHTVKELGRKLGRELVHRSVKDSPPIAEYHIIDIEPHYSTFRAQSIKNAFFSILKPHYCIWQQILIAQDFTSLPEVDMMAGVDRGKRASMMTWLMRDKPWNAEQKMVIESMSNAKGGVQLVMGPAGTGKTSLVTSISIGLAKVGMKVMVFTAANSNADHSITETVAKAEQHGLRAYRVFSSSAEQNLQSMSEQQTRHRRQDGHHDGYSSNIDHLMFFVCSQSDPKAGARLLDIEHGVIKEAEKEETAKGKLHLRQRLVTGAGAEFGAPVDIWETFRSHLDACRAGTFDDKDEKLKTEFAASYRACKRHLLRIASIVITTTGNAACAEVSQDFLDASIYKQAGFAGLFKIFEEAAKDQEPNILNGLVQGRQECVKGVIMIGDDKQLAPVNTSARGKVQYNPFRECLSKSLPTRLIEEGFPCIRLTTQHRMRHCLAEFASENCYDNTLQTAPETNQTLDPDLKRALLSPIAHVDFPADERAREACIATASDDDACLAYFEVEGDRKENDSGSMAVPEHVQFFSKKILPPLMEFFKDRMIHEMMVICPYKHAKQLYQHHFNQLRARDKSLTDAHFPKVLTAHSAQGQEANFVWLDCSSQRRNVQGFVLWKEGRKDDTLATVCITRPKIVLWMVGGDLSFKRFPGSRMQEAEHDYFGIMPKYLKKLIEQGRVHRYNGQGH